MQSRPSGWPKFRLTILERDGWVCQLRFSRCAGRADRVDHIVPPALGGAWLDPANARAACVSCNSLKGATPDDHPMLVAARRIEPSRDW
jgi:5-methylcytosine-specific restriction endonuclease McrA